MYVCERHSSLGWKHVVFKTIEDDSEPLRGYSVPERHKNGGFTRGLALVPPESRQVEAVAVTKGDVEGGRAFEMLMLLRIGLEEVHRGVISRHALHSARIDQHAFPGGHHSEANFTPHGAG